MNPSNKITEKYRIYYFPNQEEIMIEGARELSVSDSGTHRIVDVHGFLHIIPNNWLHIKINSVVGKFEV